MSSQGGQRSRIPVQASGLLFVFLLLVIFAIAFLTLRWLATAGLGIAQAWPFLLVIPAAVFGLALAFNVVLRLVKGRKVIVVDDEEE